LYPTHRRPPGLYGCSAVDELGEHDAAVIAVVAAPRILVEIRLQPLDGHAMVVPGDPVLDVAKEPLDDLRVDISTRVDTVGVADR
jgi:hypothetical protein